MNVAALLQDSPSDDRERRRQHQQQRQQQQEAAQQAQQHHQQQLPSLRDSDRALHGPSHAHQRRTPSTHRTPPDYPRDAFADDYPPQHLPPPYALARPPPPGAASPMYLPPPGGSLHPHLLRPPHEYSPPQAHHPPPHPSHLKPPYVPRSPPPPGPPLLHEPSSMYTGLPPLAAPPPPPHHRLAPPGPGLQSYGGMPPPPPAHGRRHPAEGPAMASLQPPRDRGSPPPHQPLLPPSSGLHHTHSQSSIGGPMAMPRDRDRDLMGIPARDDGERDPGAKKKRSRPSAGDAGRRANTSMSASGSGGGRRSDVDREYAREMEYERGRAREQQREREQRERDRNREIMARDREMMRERDMIREQQQQQQHQRDMRDREVALQQRQRDDMEYIRAMAAARNKPDEGSHGYMTKAEMDAQHPHYQPSHPYPPPEHAVKHSRSHHPFAPPLKQAHTPSHTIFGPTPTAPPAPLAHSSSSYPPPHHAAAPPHHHHSLPPQHSQHAPLTLAQSLGHSHQHPPSHQHAQQAHQRVPSPQPPPPRPATPPHLGAFVYPTLPFPSTSLPASIFHGLQVGGEPRATIYIPSGFLPTARPDPARVWGGCGARRVYTDDSDVLTAAVHAGLVAWPALRAARARGMDARVEVALLPRAERYVGGSGARGPEGAGGLGEWERDAEDVEEDAEEEDGRGILSGGWGSGHDGGGMAVLEVAFVKKGTAHGAPALGRKNRKQRLVEYSKARAEVMRTAGALAELPNGAHMARGNGADAEADFAADEDVAQERVAAHTTIVFAGVDARLGFKYDADVLRGLLFPDPEPDAEEGESWWPRKRRRLDGVSAAHRAVVLETAAEEFLLRPSDEGEAEKENRAGEGGDEGERDGKERRWDMWLLKSAAATAEAEAEDGKVEGKVEVMDVDTPRAGPSDPTVLPPAPPPEKAEPGPVVQTSSAPSEPAPAATSGDAPLPPTSASDTNPEPSSSAAASTQSQTQPSASRPAPPLPTNARTEVKPGLALSPPPPPPKFKSKSTPSASKAKSKTAAKAKSVTPFTPVLLAPRLTSAHVEFLPDEVRMLGAADAGGVRHGWAVEVRGWRWAAAEEVR